MTEFQKQLPSTQKDKFIGVCKTVTNKYLNPSYLQYFESLIGFVLPSYVYETLLLL